MLICLYLTKHLFEALVFIQFGGGGFDTDTLPLQIILKIRNLRRMTLPRSPTLHKKQLDVQPTFGKSKILNMIMPCCIYEYLPFFSYYPSIRLSLSLHRMVQTQITKVYSLASSK